MQVEIRDTEGNSHGANLSSYSHFNGVTTLTFPYKNVFRFNDKAKKGIKSVSEHMNSGSKNIILNVQSYERV